MGIAREPFDPCTWMVASNAANATHMSEGLVAMQCSLVPRTASVRLLPLMAGQPVPGSRLLQGMAVSRKYMQRVRWSRLPAVVAILRSWADVGERQTVNVEKLRGGFDIQFHQVEQRGAAGDESYLRALLGSLSVRGGRDSRGWIHRPDELKGFHRWLPVAGYEFLRTCW